ncbi:MAG: Mpo1-like protein [Planctomycetaceae bacterium]
MQPAPSQPSDRVAGFQDFWRCYLAEHASGTNRALHVMGTSAALVLLGLGVLCRRPSLLLLAPIVGYAPAWIGHFLIERNRPATLAHPLWSLRADLKMLTLAARGRLRDELERYAVPPQ